MPDEDLAKRITHRRFRYLTNDRRMRVIDLKPVALQPGRVNPNIIAQKCNQGWFDRTPGVGSGMALSTKAQAEVYEQLPLVKESDGEEES